MARDRPRDELRDEVLPVAQAATFGEALARATLLLRRTADATAPLDAQVLLAHITGQPRTALLAYPERALPADDARTYASLIARRAAGEPVAYITGHREFMRLDLLTDPRALIPRPETELLVEAALRDARARLECGAQPIVADIGTGTGAIAIALAVLEPRLTRLYATDIATDALALARTNVERLGVADRLTLLHGDLLIPLPQPVDLLLANLPYVAPRAAPLLPLDVAHYEPEVALYGQDDGLGHFRRLFAQLHGHLNAGATLYLEFGYDQRLALETLAHAAMPAADIRAHTDYADWDRFLEIHT